MALGSGNIQIDVGAKGLTDDIVRQVQAAEKKIRPMSVSLDNKGFRQPLGQITGDLAEFQKSLDASVARTLAFGASVGVINSLADGFKALITSAIEVEKSLADVNVILNLNAKALGEFSSELFATAKNTGQSFQTVSEAAVELSRQGLGAEETLSRINDAMILTRLSGMDAAKSVETLTAAVNSFGDTAVTTTELVNKLATVDAAFAVSTEDLANALARAGSTAQSAKVDLNELLAAVTSVQQTTARGGSVIGNAFKSIFTRIQRSGVREALEEIGVATTDAAGNIRGALGILKDYAGVYQNLTDSQKAYTDELIAGVFQINNLKALVKDLGSDYSIYERALDQSNTATDEAVRRNEKLQGTLSALMNETIVNAKELGAALGDLVATPAVENLLTIFNSISGALAEALDPEKGSKLIKGMFNAIGNFIAGPGLILIGVAFVKLFKFITGQSLKAVKEIFKIGSAANKVAQTESKIGFILKNNKALYEAISNEALSHEKKEELVLQTIKAQNAAYAKQQALISKLAKSRTVGGAFRNAAGGHVPNAAQGRIPNFTRGVEGAVSSERAAILAGEGGASRSAKPKVLKNFPMGGGRKQTIVANTDEVIVPRFGGSSGSAIFNKDMIKKSGGAPKGAIPVAHGYIPNFASSLEKNKQYKSFLNSQEGLMIDVEKDLGGFGIVSAAGTRGRQSSMIKKMSGFNPNQNKKIIDDISGSKLTQEDKKYISGVIERKRARFQNIGASSIKEIESSDARNKVKGKVGAIGDMIQPFMADAVAGVSSRIYNSILGDEVGSGLVNKVRKQANVDNSIVSASVEGGVFESALRLGSAESAKSLGRDSSDAIWDFEENGRMTSDMRDIFFGGYNILKGDAKRTGGADSISKVVEKSHKDFFNNPLESIYARHWAPFFEMGNKLTEGSRSKKRSKAGIAKALGFIPNYAQIFQGDQGLPSEAISIQPLNKIGIKSKQTVKQLSEKNKLSNAKIGSANQKADLIDSFDATIIPEYQRFKDGQFRKWSNGLSGNSIKNEGYARKLFGGTSNLFSKYGADQSAIKSLNTSYDTILNYKKAQEEFKRQKKIKNFDTFVKGKRKYKNLIGKTGVAKFDNLKNNFENKIKGTIGEITAARKEKVKIQSGNSFFDLANGKEVKTVRGEQKASAILRKGANGWLKNKNIFNEREDRISMGEISVIIPRDTVLASGGFIPNFANSLEEAVMREKDALSGQGSNAQVYVDQDNRLKGSKNPMGLLVANTRDEPLSGSQGVDRVVSTGLNPKNHGMAAGHVPNFARKAQLASSYKIDMGETKKVKQFSESVNEAGSAAGRSSSATKKMSKSLGGSVKIMGNLAIASIILDTVVGVVSSAVQVLTNDTKLFGIELENLSIAGALGYLKDQVHDVDRALIESSERYVEATEKQVNLIQQNIEKIDKFSSTLALLNKAAESGNIEAYGKFTQRIIEQAGQLENIDSEAFQKLLASAGDATKLNEATQALKDLTNQGAELKNFGLSLQETFSKLAERGSDADLSKAGVSDQDVSDLATSLTKGLSSQKIKQLATDLKDFDTTAGESGEEIRQLQHIFGELDDQVIDMLGNQEPLASAILKNVIAQSKYQVQSEVLAKAIDIARLPVKNLSSDFEKLSIAIESSSKAISKSYDVLSSIEQIRATSRLDTLKSAGTVTSKNLSQGGAQAQTAKALQDASVASESALKDFAANIIKEANKNSTEITGGLKTLIDGIKNGEITNQSALQALTEVEKNGNSEQVKAASSTKEAIQNSNSKLIAEQQKIKANLEAQLNQQKAAVVAFQRNNVLSDSQLNAFKGIGKSIDESTGLQKSQLQKASELTQVLSTLESLGADQDIIAELKESNKQLKQLENLKAAFTNLSEKAGVEFDASSLGELEDQVNEFIQSDAFGKLEQNSKSLVVALQAGIDAAQDLERQQGVKGKGDVAGAVSTVISKDSISNLASELGQIISGPLAEALKINPQLVDKLNQPIADLQAIAEAIKSQSDKNIENQKLNKEIQTKINDVLTTVVSESKDISRSGIKDASANLERAATLLENASTKISSLKFGASGFVPSFSPMGNKIAKAVQTERALGGKPVVDYNKQVGTYVRDGKTQPNFAAVKRDHPEGIKKATKNSRIAQGALSAKGFVPNYAGLFAPSPFQEQGLKQTNPRDFAKGSFLGLDPQVVENLFDKEQAARLVDKTVIDKKWPEFTGFIKSESPIISRRAHQDLKHSLLNASKKTGSEFSTEDFDQLISNKTFAKLSPRVVDDMEPENFMDKAGKKLESRALDTWGSQTFWLPNMIEMASRFAVLNAYNRNGKQFRVFRAAGSPDMLRFGFGLPESDQRKAMPAHALLESRASPNESVIHEMMEMGDVQSLLEGSQAVDTSKIVSYISGIRQYKNFLGPLSGDNARAGKTSYKIPIDFSKGLVQDGEGFKISENPKAWTGRDLKITDEWWLPKAITEQRDIVSKLSSATQAKKLADPEKYKDLQLSLKQQSKKLKTYETVKEKISKYRSVFQISDKLLADIDPYSELMTKNGLDGRELSFPSPLSPKLFDIKTPDLRTSVRKLESMRDSMLSKDITTSDPDDPSLLVSEFKNAIFNHPSVSNSASSINSFLSAGDFSNFLNRAAFINPKGLQSGIESAQEAISGAEGFTFARDDGSMGTGLKDKKAISLQLKEEAAEMAGIAEAKGAKGLQAVLDKQGPENAIDVIKQKIFNQKPDILKDLGGDPDALAARLAEEEQAISPIKARDQLYLELLGKEAEKIRKITRKEDHINVLNRIQNIKKKRPEMFAQMDDMISQRKRRIDSIRNNPSTTNQKNIPQIESEISEIQSRKNFYGTEEGLASLFFVKGNDFAKVGEQNRRLGPPIYEMVPNALEKFNKIKQELRLDKTDPEKRLAELRKGEQLFPNLKLVGNPEDYINFARMRNQDGNRGGQSGQAFESFFTNLDADSRKGFLQKIGGNEELPGKALISDMLEGQDGEAIKKILKGQLKNISKGNPAFGFVTDEVLNHGEGISQNDFVQAVKDLGIPLNTTKGISDQLKNQQARIEGLPSIQPGEFETKSVKALPDQDVSSSMSFIAQKQINDWLKKNKKFAEEQKNNPFQFLSEIIGGVSNEQLLKTPLYLKYLKDKFGDDPNNTFGTYLKDSASVRNFDAWNSFYGDGTWKKIITNKSYGSINLSEPASKNQEVLKKGLNPFVEFDNNANTRTAQALSKFVLGDTLYYGTNEKVDSVLRNTNNPMPQLKSKNWAGRSKEAADLLDKNLLGVGVGNAILEKYAPFGYRSDSKFKKDSPVFNSNKTMSQLWSVINENANANAKNDNKAAQGFIPNFSAIAGEIAASKIAGYKSPVSPSQVKTMNIPGVGKTAYNTQESVFKMPGMSQPFIAPPPSSRAASGYKKTVEKKFNFNPYGNTAADGFVPNFAKGGDVKLNASEFKAAVSSFNSATSNFSNSASEFSSSTTIMEASSKSFSAAIDSIIAGNKVAASGFQAAARAMAASSSSLSSQIGSIGGAIQSAAAGFNSPINQLNQVASSFDQSNATFSQSIDKFSRSESDLAQTLNSFSSSLSSQINAFQSSVSSLASLDFSQFANSSKVISNSARQFSKQSEIIRDAARLFSQAQLTPQPVANSGGGDSSAISAQLSSAVSSFSSNTQTLTSALSKPLQVDSGAIVSSMSSLTNALKGVEGKISLEIPNINVDINGASSVSSSIATILKNEIPKIVTSSINSEKQKIIDEVKRSIFG